MSICRISDCSHRTVGKGYCNNHYRRWVRYGRPIEWNGEYRKAGYIFETFLDNCKLNYAYNECWIWPKGKNKLGYGTVAYKGKKSALVHRVAYEYYRQVIPTGLLACHSCDTPACFNPDHIFIGTNADNVHDCIKKGRYVNWRVKNKEAQNGKDQNNSRYA